jgi:hypothetical protein
LRAPRRLPLRAPRRLPLRALRRLEYGPRQFPCGK